MQLAAGIADFRDQPPLDREMDVLVGDRKAKASCRDFTLDGVEAGDDSARLGAGKKTNLRQHLRVRDRTADIVAKQAPIEGSEAVNASTSGSRPPLKRPRIRLRDFPRRAPCGSACGSRRVIHERRI